MTISDKIKNGFVLFDGGFGTVMQALGLKPNESVDEENIKNPRRVIDVHKSYIEAGADIINANTFGINPLKYGDRTEELVKSAMKNAHTAKEECKKDVFITLDIGPSGRLLKPYGDLDFEAAVASFSRVINAGKNYADAVLIETMNDAYETKAAVVAAKENCDLPVFVTNVYDSKGKLMTGANPLSMVALLEGLGVDAIGINCGFGPDKMLDTVEEILKYASVPVIVNPNAGLPRVENNKTVFDIDANTFAGYMVKIADMGARILGGCCGTTPNHIKALKEALKDKTPKEITEKSYTVVSSYSNAVIIGKNPVLIGERINPTGKSKFKEALREKNISYILNEAVTQEEKGVHILDVNVGLPEIDEPQTMVTAIKEIQAVTSLPLQIDTSDYKAMENAMRIYGGKPMVNSVNGKKESMEHIFPLVKKYGGVVVALTLTDEGIPETADKRVEIALDIIKTAKSYGIAKKDIIVDPLCLTVSSDQKNALVTLEAVKKLTELGLNTVLGVSNISFGLPMRDYINANFFTLALSKGLSAGIINPYSKEMMYAYKSYKALWDLDENCLEYIDFASENKEEKAEIKSDTDLKTAIIKGFLEASKSETEKLLAKETPLQIINEYIIPALNVVGEGFEKKTVFLPSLLMSSECANASFDVVKEKMKSDNANKKGKIILATVKNDIHDIGKNIVKSLLQSYGFSVIDLGKDVPKEKILETAIKENVTLVGLSALMTTTVSSMEETIKLLNEKLPQCKVVVGGAVLTEEYAKKIGADKYAHDAMETVRYAQNIIDN